MPTVAFSGEVFPKNIALQWSGGPAWNDTAILMSSAGTEYRTRSSDLPRYEYDVSFAGMTAAKREKLIAFYLNHGDWRSFRFFDHSDYAVVAGRGVLLEIEDSPTGDWQLYKTYTYGSLTFYRRITKPISAISITGGTGHVIDYDTGVVTCSGTPTAWTGTFHVHARFNMRQFRVSYLQKNPTQGLISTVQSLPIVEVKQEEEEAS